MRSSSTSNSDVSRAVALFTRGLALAAIAALPFAFSFWIDPARVRGTPVAERAIAQALLDGHYVTNVANYRDRAIERLLAGGRDFKPDVLVIGSSRSQSVPAEAFSGSSFVNASLTDGRLDDLLGAFGLYAPSNRRPRQVVVNLDPWTMITLPKQEAWGPLSVSRTAMLRAMGDSASQAGHQVQLALNAFKRMVAPEYFRLAVFSFRRYGPAGIRDRKSVV